MEALTRKLGPLPVWAWAGLAVVGFYVYRRWAAAKAAAASLSSNQQLLTNAYGNVTGMPWQGYSGGATAPGQGASGTSPGSGSGAPGTTDSTDTTSTTTGAAGTVPPTVTAVTPQQAALAYVQANEIPASTPPPAPQATIGSGPESAAITATANQNQTNAYWAHRIPFV